MRYKHIFVVKTLQDYLTIIIITTYDVVNNYNFFLKISNYFFSNPTIYFTTDITYSRREERLPESVLIRKLSSTFLRVFAVFPGIDQTPGVPEPFIKVVSTCYFRLLLNAFALVSPFRSRKGIIILFSFAFGPENLLKRSRMVEYIK